MSNQLCATGNVSPFPDFWNETPIRTYLFDAFSVLLPAGEAFVIEAVQSATQTLPSADPLAHACRSFVEEERGHQRAHRAYNQRLEQQGYAAAALEHPIADDLARLSARLSADQRLSLAAAFEHITAVISKAALRHERLLTQSDSAQAKMWRWHCGEEVAHAGVTNELLAARHVSYGSRVGWFTFALLVLAYDLLRNVLTFYRADRARARVTRAAFLRSVVALTVSGGLPAILIGLLGYVVPRGRPTMNSHICVRALQASDVPRLLALETACWTSEQAVGEAELRSRIERWPELSLGAFCTRTGAALASLFMKPTSCVMAEQAENWRACVDNEPPASERAEALFGISLSSVNAHAVRSILEYFWPHALKRGWRYIYLGSPIPGLHKWAHRNPQRPVKDYVYARRRAMPQDPQLRYYHQRGFRHIVAVRCGYFPHAESLDHGAVLRGTIPGAWLAPLWRRLPLRWLLAMRTLLFRLL